MLANGNYDGTIGVWELATGSEVRSWQRMERFHADYLRGCSDWAPLGAHSRCSWRVAGSRGEVVLIGDSNAGQFTEPFVRAANALRLTGSVATYSSCPFVETKSVVPFVFSMSGSSTPVSCTFVPE